LTVSPACSTEKPAFIDIIFSDFDGVKFHLFTPSEAETSVVHLSLSWAVLPSLLKGGAQAKLQKEYGAFLIAAESGYDVSLKLDTSKLTPEQKTRIPFHFAMLKRNIFAAPFADYFDACAAKKDMSTLEVKYRTDESVFLKTEQDRCIVIFNVHFVDKDDQLLGKVCHFPLCFFFFVFLFKTTLHLKVFIEEFVHARKALAAAPSCSFSLVEPPRELDGLL
jgi:actin related protein 2/3 complex subunit 2